MKASRAHLSEAFVERASRALASAGLDGWLLYDLEGRNRVSTEILGLSPELSRRWFVLLRPGAPPVALVHRIETQPWRDWQGELRKYVGWEELEGHLEQMLERCDWIAMEVSERDAVPFVDNVPAGVVEMVEAVGPRVVSSADLVTETYARWGEPGRKLHLRAAGALAGIARRAFRHAATELRADRELTEHDLLGDVRRDMEGEGLGGGGALVAAGPNSAIPHYAPAPEGSRALEPGDVLLIDLWGRIRGRSEAVFADQTWMGVLGTEPPDGFAEAWAAVREARDAAVELIALGDGRDGIEDGPPAGEGAELPTGAEVDLHVREILADHGFGDAILHRTGHAIDRVNHGFGPNLDAVETRDERRLVEGIGFSVEPGVYLEGRWGIRSEINVYLGSDGPEVTTPDPQREPWTPGD